MMLLELLIALPFVGGPLLPAGEAAESVYRTYDLAAHCGRDTHYERDGHLFPGSLVSPELPEFDRDIWTFEPSMIVDTLHSFLLDELEYEGRHYGITENDGFALYAPESVHRQVRQILSVFSHASRSSAHLQVDIFNVPAGSASLPAGVLKLEDAKKALDLFADQLTESYSIPLKVSLPSSIEAAKRQECLLDYDVEVASNSMSFDPIMVSMLTGTRLQVKANPSANGCDLALIYWNGDQARKMKSHPFDTRGVTNSEQGRKDERGPEVIQSTSIKQRTLALNTSIPRERALVLGLNMDVHGGQSEQRVMLRLVGEMQPNLQSHALGADKKLHLVRRDFLTPSKVNLHGGGHALAGSVGRLQDKLQKFSWEFLATFDNEESEFGIDLLQTTLEDSELMFPEGWMLCLENGEASSKVQKTLEQLVTSMTPPSELLQVSMEVQRPGKERNVLSYQLPLRIGAQSALVLGVESSAIRDYDVEIAQGSSVADPITCIDLDGAICLMRPTRTEDGRIQLHVQLTAQVIDQAAQTGSQDGSFGRIDQARYSQLVLDQIVPFGADGAQTVQLGNSTRTGEALGLKVTLGPGVPQVFDFNMSVR